MGHMGYNSYMGGPGGRDNMLGPYGTGLNNIGNTAGGGPVGVYPNNVGDMTS